MYLVATGSLVTGTYSVPSQRIAQLRATTQGVPVDFDPPLYAQLGPLNINVTARACAVTSGANNAVTMPTLLVHSLKTVGAVSDASASFSIAVKCDANLGLYATVTDASDPTNTSNTLTLASNSTASGVGIQMFRSGKTTPLLFGPDSSKKGNTNQWFIGNASASGSTFTIPMVAKYVKTLPVIKPGSVSARSTITFSYQ
ncbi:fimbrial protein [Cupriavidus sp. 2MCAB6]|uniref:fimbrial protein n=1 Tax=Cupriavidus sp. 2MCAB6 TaxID=3232981 RepID=UPI003F8DAEA4